MGDSKRKWTTDEEASLKRRNLSVMRDGKDFQRQTKTDDLILEAIAKLNEPRGSTRSVIFRHIEGHENAPSNLEWQLTTRLEALTKKGKLMKAKRRYKIAPDHSSSSSGVRGNMNDAMEMPTKEGVDEELEQMKKMSIHEAEMMAAKAVAEAEAAIAAAERALEEANEAEAIAEEMAKALNGCSISSKKKQQWWEKIRND